MTAAVEPAAPRPSRGRPRDEQIGVTVRREAVLLLADQGYGAFTIEAVAARTGIAKSTIYRRWASKDELIFDALAELKGPIPQPPGQSVRGDLRYVLEAIRAQWSDGLHGRLMRRLAVDGSENPEHYRQFQQRLIAPRQQVLRDIVERGVAEGLIDPGIEVEWLLHLLVAPIIAAGLTHRVRVRADQVEAQVDILLRGIAPK